MNTSKQSEWIPAFAGMTAVADPFQHPASFRD
jgi:hypothetical protein